MEDITKLENPQKFRLLINLISIAVPVAVAILLSMPNKLTLGAWTKDLSHVIGLINALTTVTLILGLVFIKLKKIGWHQTMMTVSFAFGGIFLVCYILYHISNPSNNFTGTGAIRYFYLFTLITHIALSLIVLPLVLRAMAYAITGQFAAHKKIARFAYPIWLYVSTTGVIVYLLLYHIFPAK